MPRTYPPRLRMSALVVGLATAITAAVGVSTHAAAAPVAPVSYSAKLVGKTVKVDVKNGTLSVENDRLAFKNTAGKTVMAYPLSYNMEDRKFPIEAKTAGRSATLTPVTNVARSSAVPASQLEAFRHAVACKNGFRGPQTRQQRDDEAFNRFLSQMSASMGIGSLIGMAIGAAAGLVGIFGGPLVIPAVITGASIGAVVGTIASGAPIIEYWNQYNRTINSRFKPLCA